MKRQVSRALLAVGAISVIGTALYAQSYNMRVDVPFAFQVNNQSLAPGIYRVSQASVMSLSLRSIGTGHTVFVTGASPTRDGASATGKLVFRCYNGRERCFLAEVWPAGETGTSIARSKNEKSLSNGDRAREMAVISVDVRRAD